MKKPNNRFNLTPRPVMVCAVASLRTNHASLASQVKRMLGGPFGQRNKRENIECYAKPLGDCSVKMSKEHVISKVLLPEKVGINGLQWCMDEEVFVGKNSFTIKNLCQKHNSELSPYDAEMQLFFITLDRIISSSKSIKLNLNGRNIERWILKTAINLNSYFENGNNLYFEDKVVLPYLFRNKKFQYPWGLTIVHNTKKTIESKGKIRFSSLFSKVGEIKIVDSFIMNYRGFTFKLDLDTEYNLKNIDTISVLYSPQYHSPNGIKYIWHPLKINTDNPNNRSKI